MSVYDIDRKQQTVLMYDMVLDMVFPIEDRRRSRSLHTRRSVGAASQGLAFASVLPGVFTAGIGETISESRSICLAPMTLGVLLFLVFAVGFGIGLGLFSRRTKWETKWARRI